MKKAICWDLLGWRFKPLRAAEIFQLSCRLDWAQPFGAASTKLHQNNLKRWVFFLSRHYHAACSQCKYTHLLVEGQLVLRRHVHKIVGAVPILQCRSIVQAEKQGYLSITFHRKCHIGRLEASACTCLLLFSTWKSMGIFCRGFDLYKLAESALQTVYRGRKTISPIREVHEDWLPPEAGEGEIPSMVLASCSIWSKGPSAIIREYYDLPHFRRCKYLFNGLSPSEARTFFNGREESLYTFALGRNMMWNGGQLEQRSKLFSGCHW